MQHVAGALTRPNASLRLLAFFRPKPDGTFTWVQAWAGVVLSTAMMWGLMAAAHAVPAPSLGAQSAETQSTELQSTVPQSTVPVSTEPIYHAALAEP